MKIKNSLIILMIIPFLLINKIVRAETNNYNEKTYKVGIIDFEPYGQVDGNGEFKGFYIDFFDLIAKELNLKYEYVSVNNFESINKLETGELDFSLGITITDSREEKVIFNVTPIAFEKFALYTNKDIDSYNLSELNGLRFGSIKGRASDWIIDFFKASNIEVEIVYGNSYEEINELLENGSIDLILDSAYKETKYKKIYEFVESQVHIAANKNNQEIINDIDDAIIKIENKESGKIEKLYNSYFHKEKFKKENLEKFLNIILEIILIISILIFIFKKLKVTIFSIYIKIKKDSGIYKVEYEPIYKVSNGEIIGFESLIKHEGKVVLYKRDIMHKFKENNIIYPVLLLHLERLISDYKTIKESNFWNKKDFYLAINIPIDQFKYKKFVDKAIEMLSKSNLSRNSICIEVIGNINIKDINIISQNIKRLKEAGFLIAIDDFGIEYSNLNIIQNLDIDIIKIDETFTSNMDKSIIKDEIIRFILRIAKAEDKFVVLESIYEANQDRKIREIDNDKLYVQGEFYSKIISVEEIRKVSN